MSYCSKITATTMKKTLDRKYAGYAVKFNVSSFWPLPRTPHVPHVRRWSGRQIAGEEGGVAGVESGANPDRVHTRNLKQKSINPTLMSNEMAHFEINFVPRLNPYTFQPNFHCVEYVTLAIKSRVTIYCYMHFILSDAEETN